MTRGTITRDALIEAVEAGIKDADRTNFLTEAEKIALRHVARTENKVACGGFTRPDFETGETCRCPLNLAGLDWQSPEAQSRPFQRFYSAYDKLTTPLGSVLTVVD